MDCKLDNVQLAHLEGFVKQCQDLNIDPEQMLQIIEEQRAIANKKNQLKDVGAGALRGGITGAAVGGTAGAFLPLVIAAAFMARDPEMARTVKLGDLAKLIASGGIMGAAGGGALGAGIGGVGASVAGGTPSGSRLGAAMKGMGRGAATGAVLGTAGGVLGPIAQLLALKARGGNMGSIGAGNIAKVMGRSALTGMGTGLLGGAGFGAALGASIGKTASQRIWDKMGAVPVQNAKANVPPATNVMGISTADMAQDKKRLPAQSTAMGGQIGFANRQATTLGGGQGSGSGLTARASAEELPVKDSAMIKRITVVAKPVKYVTNNESAATKTSSVDKLEPMLESKDITADRGLTAEQPAKTPTKKPAIGSNVGLTDRVSGRPPMLTMPKVRKALRGYTTRRQV